MFPGAIIAKISVKKDLSKLEYMCIILRLLSCLAKSLFALLFNFCCFNFTFTFLKNNCVLLYMETEKQISVQK